MSPEKQTSRDLPVPEAVHATSLILLGSPLSQTLLTLRGLPLVSANISQKLAQVFCPADSWERHSCAFRLSSLETPVPTDLLPSSSLPPPPLRAAGRFSRSRSGLGQAWCRSKMLGCADSREAGLPIAAPGSPSRHPSSVLCS